MDEGQIEASLRSRLVSAREIANSAGTIHAGWDAIFDAEAWLENRDTLTQGSDRLDIGRKILSMLAGAKSVQPT